MELPSALLCLAAVAVAVVALTGRAQAGETGLSFRLEPLRQESSARAVERRGGVAAGRAGHGPRQRRPKLISFSTDNSQIGVELGFTVPLLKVPLQGARGAAEDGHHAALGGLGGLGPVFKEPIDVNVGALFVAGSMLLTVMGIVPAIYQAFAAKPVHAIMARSAEDFQGSAPGWLHCADRFLWAAEAALARRGVDARSCGARLLCRALAGAAERVRRGGAGSMDLVLHGVARSPWVSQWVSGTKLQDAASGEEDSDHCAERFTRCTLPAELASLLGDNNALY